jgi:hypothetical protein
MIPVVHTPEDLGSQREAVERHYVEHFGRVQWLNHLQAITEFWDRLEQQALGLALDFTRARLYQDGLPVCGREREIVADIARDGSRNHRLLLSLMKRGGTLEGTEEIALLMEERERLLSRRGAPETSGGYDELMLRRDAFIADRIDATLREEETGLLFIGAMHRVKEQLASGIEVLEMAEAVERYRTGPTEE